MNVIRYAAIESSGRRRDFSRVCPLPDGRGSDVRISTYRRRWNAATLVSRTPIRLVNGALRTVELHWYEAHGIGRRDLKIKRYLDE